MIKVCPFTTTKDKSNDAINMTSCVGDKCINFDWKGVEENKASGSCAFFDRWTGHQMDINAKKTN